MLNAANDRFFNFQWYVGDPTTASTDLNGNGEVIGATEVALDARRPRGGPDRPGRSLREPVQGAATAGPDWIAIGSEGGFLPAPTVVDGQQPTTWITDPTRFDVGNVDQHSLLLAPAERADAIVDFSKFAGKTLILYNDAPAAFPARVPSYDYYTGAPDLSPNGAPGILPGYGPNTRTIMQVKIAVRRPGGRVQPDQAAERVQAQRQRHRRLRVRAAPDHRRAGRLQLGLRHDLRRQQQLQRPRQHPPALRRPRARQRHAELRLQHAPQPDNQQVDVAAAAEGDPRRDERDDVRRVRTDAGEPGRRSPAADTRPAERHALPVREPGDGADRRHEPAEAERGLRRQRPAGQRRDISPISSATDGTQIWRITHNGVDTHPIHFHLYDVQVLNRVTWDNIIIQTDPTELGWKDTVRISPLQDTIVALRPIIPEVPWELPNAIRPLNPMMPIGSTAMFNNFDVQGNPTAQIINQLVNFGWEYVYHCHILSHEEMDMMRPVSVALPPLAPDGLTWVVTGSGNNTRLTLTWNDNSINETSFVVQRKTGAGAWANLPNPVLSPLDQPNTHGTRSYTDTTFRWNSNAYAYRVVARNTIGYGGAVSGDDGPVDLARGRRAPCPDRPYRRDPRRPRPGQPDVDGQRRQRDGLRHRALARRRDLQPGRDGAGPQRHRHHVLRRPDGRARHHATPTAWRRSTPPSPGSRPGPTSPR